MRPLRTLVVVALALVCQAARGEPPPIRLRGLVVERGTRDLVPGATVAVLDAVGNPIAETQAGEDGTFALRFSSTIGGTLDVVVAAGGHNPLRLREKLATNEALTVKYALARSSYASYESIVRAPPSREEVSRVSLDREEVLRIPGTHGDALAAALNLPSVARSPFDLGQLVIRGSQPGESGAFLAGMAIPQAFHFALTISTFNSYLLDRFDLIPSNFSVRYGRLTGGLVDIVPREGKSDRVHGELKLDLYDAHAIVEGPVGKGSFALAIRRSYVDAVLSALPSTGFTLAPRYYDYQALFDYPLGGGHLKLIVFGSDDAAVFVSKQPLTNDPSLVGQFQTHLWFHQLIASYAKKWRTVEWETTLAFSGQHQDGSAGLAASLNLDLVETDVRSELRWRMSRQARFTFGLDVQSDYFWATANAPSPTTEEQVQPPLAIETKKQLNSQGFEPYPAVYGQVEWKPLPQLIVTPGVRVDWYSGSGSRTYVQPRVMTRLLVAHETWLKAGAGLYSMPPQTPYNDPTLGNPAIRPEQAVHVTVGVETRPIRRWRPLFVDVNLFYKDLRYLVVGSDALIQRDGKIVPELYTDEGYGRVYGADLLIKHDSSKWVYGWLAYTIMKAERQDHPGEPFRPFQYDQTNILTLVAGTHLPLDFDVGVRLRWVTGNPDTSLLATRGTVYDSDHDVYLPQPAPPFSSRLPDFVQLDVRVDKRFAFRSFVFSIYLDISNVTNRQNVEGYAYSYDFTARTPVTGLPILPSLGLRATF